MSSAVYVANKLKYTSLDQRSRLGRQRQRSLYLKSEFAIFQSSSVAFTFKYVNCTYILLDMNSFKNKTHVQVQN